VTETLRQIDLKALKRRIFATTPPTDLLHRALLLNTAYILVYNHVFMALPTLKNQGDALQKEVLSFLWTRQVDGNTVWKRRLVAKNRMAASHSMGGMQVQHPAEYAGSLQLNLIHRIYHGTCNNQRQSILPSLLGELLRRVNRPTLEDHVQQLGPVQWAANGKLLADHNLLLSQSFCVHGKIPKVV
jgi:hypothetical protein